MSKPDRREVWQRGPIEDIPGLLQPVAHAFLQAREEVNELLAGFPDMYLWQRPGGVASVGFHLQHLSGVTNRLFTYAKGEALDAAQLKSLSEEGKPVDGKKTVASLLEIFNKQVDKALQELALTDEGTLTEPRLVGRARIPSTVIGILVHSAEHTMRHVGQLHVTVRIIKDGLKKGL
jgi:uncharacterized damage-inducible protein DinB